MFLKYRTPPRLASKPYRSCRAPKPALPANPMPAPSTPATPMPTRQPPPQPALQVRTAAEGPLPLSDAAGKRLNAAVTAAVSKAFEKKFETDLLFLKQLGKRIRQTDS